MHILHPTYPQWVGRVCVHILTFFDLLSKYMTGGLYFAYILHFLHICHITAYLHILHTEYIMHMTAY